MIDKIDKKILTIVQDNGRTSNAEIARQVGMAPSAVLERMRKLERKGIIKGFDLNMSLSAAADSETRTLESRNVIGVLPLVRAS